MSVQSNRYSCKVAITQCTFCATQLFICIDADLIPERFEEIHRCSHLHDPNQVRVLRCRHYLWKDEIFDEYVLTLEKLKLEVCKISIDRAMQQL